jgi:hypothetical protein
MAVEVVIAEIRLFATDLDLRSLSSQSVGPKLVYFNNECSHSHSNTPEQVDMSRQSLVSGFDLMGCR